MSTTIPDQLELPSSRRGTPTWEILRDYPLQGEWSESEYLALDSGRLIEFTEGVLEFLPMPTLLHQDLAMFLRDMLKTHQATCNLGRPYVAPCPVRIGSGRYREPDVFFLKHERIKDRTSPPDGADLVIEVVSEGKQARNRDLREKRHDYAAAGIPEYWIVDPETTTVTVLTLDGQEYRLHGEFQPDDTADSVLFPGFEVDVTAIFDAGKTTAE